MKWWAWAGLAGLAVGGGGYAYYWQRSGKNPHPPFKFAVGQRVKFNFSVPGPPDPHGNYVPPKVVTATGIVTKRDTEKDVGRYGTSYANYYDIQLDAIPGYFGSPTHHDIEANLSAT